MHVVFMYSVQLRISATLWAAHLKCCRGMRYILFFHSRFIQGVLGYTGSHNIAMRVIHWRRHWEKSLVLVAPVIDSRLDDYGCTLTDRKPTVIWPITKELVRLTSGYWNTSFLSDTIQKWQLHGNYRS